MKCLVTGHKGYIGSKLFKRLVEEGHEVRGIDIDDPQSGPIEDVLTGEYSYRPDYIFHLACFPSVQASVEDPMGTLRNNVVATSVVLDFARRSGCKRVIYSSSAAVVGEGSGPESPYALQKLMSEMEAQLYTRLYGVDTVSLRYYNVYSPDQQAKGPYASVVANWMEYLRRHKSPFITGDGTQTRDMLHVDDVVSANLFVCKYPTPLGGAVFDVGTGTSISLNEMRKVVEQSFPGVAFDYIPARPGDIHTSASDPSRLIALGWSPSTPPPRGIGECFQQLSEIL